MASKAFDDRGIWPSETQELLLRAALLEGAASRAAFESWSSRVDLQTLDQASIRLLPLLHHNLLVQGIGDSPIAGFLRGLHRQTWYKNKMLLDALSRVLECLHERGIRTLLLKGVPLALGYYPALALRPMSDADILVPDQDARAALGAAAAAGLTPQFEEREWPPRMTASKLFTAPGGWEFDLHTHVMHECLDAGVDDAFWAAAVPMTVGAVPTCTLAPEDHALHVLVHGIWPNGVPPIRWIADVAMILRRQGSRFDWIRLEEQARVRHLSRTAASGFRYVCDRIGVAVPADVLHRLACMPVGLAERLEYQSRFLRGGRGTVAMRVSEYIRARRRDREWQGPFGFARFMRDRWGLESSWQLPGAARAKLRARRNPNGPPVPVRT